MLVWIPQDNDTTPFPDPETAMHEPDGLLAAGGSLNPARLLMAYRNGIFPWYSEGEPILWWSPSTRAVIYSKDIHISRSMNRLLRQNIFTITRNKNFNAVIQACAAPREDNQGTWITAEMMQAYCELHTLGHAHSLECWHNDKLVGGMYGIKIGKLFCGESMFSKMANASKAVLIHAAQADDIDIIDCQIQSDHLTSMGAVSISRQVFLDIIKKHTPPQS